MASTELESTGGGLAAVERPAWRFGAALPVRRVGVVARREAWSDLAAVGILLATLVAVHWPTIVGLGLYARSDTFTFFYPVFATLHRSLREGDLPLWSPLIFGGFPLFAEGQVGAMYPPNLLAAVMPSPLDGFLALRVFHVGVAELGMYLFVRAIGGSALGACLAGLVFGFGSFGTGQQHHANLLAAAVWLPPLLASVELALRRGGCGGLAYSVLAGGILGLQALASHVQPVMLSGLLVLLYVAARQVAGMRRAYVERREPDQRRRVVLRLLRSGLLTAALVPALGATLAAVQLLPLYELSQHSVRAFSWTYRDAVEYSFPPLNLLTLLFPFFFRSPDGGQWSLWQAWEVVLYVGVVPLVLALVALVAVRRWTVPFFGLVGAVSLLLALGEYAPFDLYERIWMIPGLNVQRAPSRFTFLTTISLAVLAAHGADWLARDRPKASGGRLLLLATAVLVGLAVIVGHLVIWRSWLQADRWLALETLREGYLAQFQDSLQGLTPLGVYLGLEAALDPANPKTAMTLGLLGLFGLLLLAWRELPARVAAWRAVLAALVVVDMVLFASDFHPLVATERLAEVGRPGEFLATQSGRWRSLTHPDVETIRPNQLMPPEVSEASGYSPLQLERHARLMAAVGTVDNSLVDLWNVRYRVEPAGIRGLPSYQGLAYHPGRPLLIGGAATPNGRLVLDVPNETATELRSIVALRGGQAIPDGAVVGEWLLTDTDGVRRVFPVRAGRELADWSTGQPNAVVVHRPAEAAGALPIEPGQPTRTLSHATASLPRRLTIVRAEYRHLHPLGQTVLYGVGLYDAEDRSLAQSFLPAKYRVAYRDGDVAILENGASFSRAFVVPEAIWVGDGASALSRLMDGPLDPTRQVVVEGTPSATDATGRSGAPGRAELVEERARVVTIQATASDDGYLVLTDAFFPGWRAFVDGEEVEVLRANYAFRAVAVPAGEHEVAFVYDPPLFRLGVQVSIAALLAAAVLGGLGLIRARRSARGGATRAA